MKFLEVSYVDCETNVETRVIVVLEWHPYCLNLLLLSSQGQYGGCANYSTLQGTLKGHGA